MWPVRRPEYGLGYAADKQRDAGPYRTVGAGVVGQRLGGPVDLFRQHRLKPHQRPGQDAVESARAEEVGQPHRLTESGQHEPGLHAIRVGEHLEHETIEHALRE